MRQGLPGLKNFKIRKPESVEKIQRDDLSLASKMDKMINIFSIVASKLQEHEIKLDKIDGNAGHIESDAEYIYEVGSSKKCIISNSSEYSKNNLPEFQRQMLDPRDKVLSFPFKFVINIQANQSKLKQSIICNQPKQQHSKLFTESETYKQLCQQIEDFFVDAVETIISISFNMLIDKKLSDGETKDFASKNILLNVHSVCKEIMTTLIAKQIIIGKEQIKNLEVSLVTLIDDTLKQILQNISQYYPQSPPTGGSARLRQILLAINRSQNEEMDFLYRQQLLLKKQTDGNYVQYIMEVLNRAILVTNQTNSQDVSQKTLYDKFYSFSTNLFWLAQEDSYSGIIHQIYNNDKIRKKQNNIQSNQSSHISKQQLSTPLIEEADQLSASNKINSIGSFLKDPSQNFKEIQKLIMTSQKKSNNAEDKKQNTIQQMKNAHQFEIGHKLPINLKCFTKKQIKQRNFTAKHSSVLRMLTKWAQSLQDIFDNPQKYTLNRTYPFKTLNHELIYPSKDLKRYLCKTLLSQKDKIAAIKQQLITQNKQYQGIFISHKSSSISKFIKRYTDTRIIASKMNAMLIEFMVQYVSQLINLLVSAGRRQTKYYMAYQMQSFVEEINLVSFKIGDLMRSKIHCNQATFIRMLKTLYILDETEDKSIKFLQLVRIKNKLDSKDNNILINYTFMGQVQCELQMSIQQISGKQQHYYSFNHYLYELIRGKFGVLSQCATIVSQHDPIIAASSQKIYYEPKTQRKRDKIDRNKTRIKGEESVMRNSKNQMFVCQVCQKFKISENIQLLKRQKSQEQCCNDCIAKGILKLALKLQKQTTSKSSIKQFKQSYLSNQQLSQWIINAIEQHKIKKIVTYDQLKVYENMLIFSINFRKNELQFGLLSYEQTQLEWFITRLSTDVFSENEELVANNIEHQNITNLIKNKAKVNQFTYAMPARHQNDLKQIFALGKQNNMKNIVQKLNKIEVISQSKFIKGILQKTLKNKNQILSFMSSLDKFAMMQKLVSHQSQRNWLNSSLKHLQFIYAESLKLTTIPTWINKCNKLKILDLTKNNISAIQNISEFTGLIELRLDENQLTSVEWSNNTSLQKLTVSKNKLTSFGLSQFYNLKQLILVSNKIGMISLENVNELKVMDLTLNNLTAIAEKHLSKSIQILKINGNKINKFELQKYSYLKQIDISNNQITEVNLENIPQLKKAYFAYNKISEMNLTNLLKLQILNISHNNLEKLPLQQLPPSLKDLNINKNNFKQLKISNLPYFESLLAIQNNLEKIQLNNLPFLNYLNLQNNHFINFQLSNMPKLEQIYLMNNKLTSLSLQNLPLLTSLNIESNQLTSIDRLVNVPALKDINANKNKIKYNQIMNLPNSLQSISLCNNSLQTFDINCLPASVKKIVLRSNAITSVNFDGFSGQLQHLDLNSNAIKKIDLQKIPKSVMFLDLGQNSFSNINVNSLPKKLTYLNLEQLWIKQLDLRKLPKSLNSLYLGNNSLSLCEFQQMPNLTFLRLTNNNLSQLKLAQMPNLKYLSLSMNKLTQQTLDLSIFPKSIEQLDISQNKFTKIEISEYLKLRELSLSRNKIKQLNLRLLPSLKQLQLFQRGLSIDKLNLQDLSKQSISLNCQQTMFATFKSAYPMIKFKRPNQDSPDN